MDLDARTEDAADQPPSPGQADAPAAGWYSVYGTTQRFWDGYLWTQAFRERPTSRAGSVIAAVFAALAFLAGGFIMAFVQAAADNSLFEPLINGLGWMSFGASAAIVMWIADRASR